MIARTTTLLVILLSLFACSSTYTIPTTETTQAKAQRLAHKYLIVDTHIDIPYRLQEKPEDISIATEGGDFDYPRATRGGLNVPFMSIYIPPAKENEGTATAFADELIDGVEALVAHAPKKFALAHNTTDVEQQFKPGVVSLALGMENGAPIAGDLKNLDHFYQRGIRYITLAHSKSNHISDSSYDEVRQWNGLSPFGEELVNAMNDIGMMIDISHVSDEAFYDVVKLTRAPVIASHSSARHFTPGFERNMDDEMIKALAENGGLIMINFGSTFVHQPSRDSYQSMYTARMVYLHTNNLVGDNDASAAFAKNYFEKKPFLFADVEHVLDHIDHVRDLVGIDYVGLGSDFDGVGDTLPTNIKDVSMYPNLIAGMLQRGYSESDIEKVLGSNLMRVWREVEAIANAQ